MLSPSIPLTLDKSLSRFRAPPPRLPSWAGRRRHGTARHCLPSRSSGQTIVPLPGPSSQHGPKSSIFRCRGISQLPLKLTTKREAKGIAASDPFNLQFTLVPDVVIAANHPFVGCQLFESHGPSCMELLRTVCHFCAKAHLSSIGKTSRSVHIDSRRIDRFYK